MKALEEINVSVYQNVYSKKPQNVSFLEVVMQCIRPVHSDTINTIRRYYKEGDLEAAQKIKSNLPCFTPAGTFDGAHAIRNFRIASCIVGLDYDHVSNRLDVIRRCADDPHTVAALESPTDGVKVFAYVEGIEGKHREGQQLVAQYYDHLLGLQSDPACKDESRLCYFTYSPAGYVACLYQAFVLDIVPTVTPHPATPEKAPQCMDEKTIHTYISSYIFLYPLTPGQRHTNLFKLSCDACRRGYPQTSILREITAYFEQTDFPSKEIESIISSGYQIVKTKTSIPEPTVSTHPQKDKKDKMPYSTIENTDDLEEAYWQGEEFRQQTPCFPDELYNNLPELLNDSLIEDEGQREKDISFLSNLTALSAALPQTFGIYNHKKYSPHFYSFVIAPAGSGKSVAQSGRYLLEEVHASILSASEHSLKVYKKDVSHWQTECQKRKKTQEPCPEEPEIPKFKMLIIPATTSYTRMQLQMKDNGDQGSIIFDTEAQTLTNANHLDCGNFDDMLCKGFEHEPIGSSYKANGRAPVYIHYPQLALFLTGTPGQVDGLLNNSENGLASRILYYTFRGMPQWKMMGDESVSQEDLFKLLAHRVSELYHFCLNHPALFHFSRAQWMHLNDTFARLLSGVATEGNDDLQAVVKRYAFLVMRLSMIQARIRQFECKDSSSHIYCTDIDFERSLQIVLCCYEHGRLILSSMPSPSNRPLKDPDDIRHFIHDLPDTFTTAEAIETGAIHNLGQRKVIRLLKRLNGVNINKLSHGKYQKLTDK